MDGQRDPRGDELLEQGERPRSHEDAGDGPEDGQEQALGQELPDDPAAGRAQGRPHRDLAPTRGGAGQEQARDVGAGDQEDGGDGQDEHDQGPARVSQELLAQGQHEGPEALVREVALEAPRHDRDVFLRLGQAGPRLGARDHLQIVGAPVGQLLGREGRRYPEPDVPLHELELPRHHPHHRVLLAVQEEVPAENARIASESSLPEPVAQHDHAGRAGPVLLGGEHAPDPGGHAEQGEEGGGDTPRLHLLRLAVARQHEARGRGRRHLFERLALSAQGPVARRREVVAREADRGGVVPDHQETLGVAEGQLSEQDRAR